jgi:energy-coupling factor transporter ATP-binding protein EcfA2
MKFFIEKAVFVNRAPFDNLNIDFNENEVAVLTAVNGRGKTTFLSHIVDAFHELAKPHFPNEFENKSNKFYRVSSLIYNLNMARPSFVYFRFKLGEEKLDYLDIRGVCTEQEYNEAIRIEDKISFGEISQRLNENKFIKKVSNGFSKQKAEVLFSNNLVTYFPSYRYEIPGYLNDTYKKTLDFNKFSGFSGYLINPIEVITGLPQLANWIMDIVLDMRLANQQVTLEHILFQSLNTLISKTLISKNFGDLRFGIGARGLGGQRIQIIRTADNSTVYPTIFNLSAGETSLLCLFGELLRQADNYKHNILIQQISGIVLVDEVDKHLHIKLQKEVLPMLLGLFPNVQFILSSHSPFLSMGLSENLLDRSTIVDLDNLGVSRDPYTTELYNEVYVMMLNENERFKEQYLQLEQIVNNGNRPLVITEGKTDVQHIRKAKEILNIENCDVDFYEIIDDWGDSKLKLLLEQLSKVNQSRRIIGIFDRDVPAILSDVERNGQNFKEYSNNVFSFCIPVPVGRENYSNISIEFYYNDAEIKKEKDGKALFFDNEVDFLHNKSISRPEIRKLETVRIEAENAKKIFDEQKMCEVADWIHSKASFARLIETDAEYISDFDFTKFHLIFDRIRMILNHGV